MLSSERIDNQIQRGIIYNVPIGILQRSFVLQPVVLITGATGGIGSLIAKGLAAASYRLMLCSKDSAKLEQLGIELQAEVFPGDLTDSGTVSRLFQTTLETYGQIDHVIHAVGSMVLKPAHLTRDEEWKKTLDTNLSSAFYLIREVYPAMKERGGSVVLFSSAAARVGLPNHEAIAAAKAGLIGLMLSAASTYADRNIRINCVAPGLVDTPLAARITSHPASLEASQKLHPLHRIGKPEEVADFALWLVEQTWITGQVFGIDGGLSTLRPKG